MKFRRCVKLVLVGILINCLFFTAATMRGSSTQSGGDSASTELRKKIFQQVLADFPELRQCIEGEEGGLPAALENMTVELIDLNHDGVQEYEVELSGACSCGVVNCSIYFYRKTPHGFESILNDAAGLGVELLKTSSNGYTDLVVTARDIAATQSQTTYRFNGKQYQEARTTLVHMETGETKPAFRRLQFRRGTSQTTVHGRVSIALPDTFRFGARAGQVLTVKLTSRRKIVRLLVMSPTTRSLLADNTRNWSGVLPETGEYQILIDGDEHNTAYSMTISIQ